MRLSPVAWMLILGMLVGSLGGKTRRKQKLTHKDLVDLARDAGFDDPEYAATIAERESGGNPYAVNFNPPRETSYGLWQINTLAWPKYAPNDLLDPKRNAEAAHDIYKQAGWSPWSTAHERRSKGPPP